MNGSTPYIILHSDLHIEFCGSVDDRVLEDRDEGSSHGGGGGQTGILDSLAHEKVEVIHVGEMLVVLLSTVER